MKSTNDQQMQLDLYLQKQPATILAAGRNKPSKYIYVDVEMPALMWMRQMCHNKLVARKAGIRVIYDLQPGGYYGPR